MLRTLDLFSGIGGMSLGLERAGGFRTVAFCEIEVRPRATLNRHWPEVPCYDDVRTLTGARLAADGISVDVICGGFPCQDISVAGRGAGLDGARSGLWSEYARLVGEVGPRWVVIENSPALRVRGADRVLSDLEELGYTCFPGVVGAVHAGAPHRRLRAWILAYAEHKGRSASGICGQGQAASTVGRGQAGPVVRPGSDVAVEALDDTLRRRHGLSPREVCAGWDCSLDAGGWVAEPNVDRVADGVSDRLDRSFHLGNAVVPAIAEAHGRAILAVEAARATPAVAAGPLGGGL